MINYFEQMLHLDKAKRLPRGILATWEPWLAECVRAPHFRWVWKRLENHYEPALRKRINDMLSKSKELPAL